jgi:hypothetical protein
MKVVSFYTKDTPYAEEVQNLIESCEKYKVNYSIEEVENLGKWEWNCGQKPKIIQNALKNFPNENLFYVDADAVFKREPNWSHFEDLQYPAFAWFKWQSAEGEVTELLSGSIYIPNNEFSDLMIRAWCALQEQNKEMWDQRVLQHLVTKHDLPSYQLPLEWCKVADYMKSVDNPYIEHYQASRRFKDKLS